MSEGALGTMECVQSRVRSALSIVGREALRIVLPAWCVACRSELPWRDRMASCCSRCWESLPRITVAKCPSCALPSPAPEAESFVCIGCVSDPMPLDWCDAWGEYRGPLERVLHALKFERHDFLDDALAALLEETLAVRGDLDFDAVTAVPMQRARERRRGYNQAELLARAVSRRVGVRCDTALLIRTRDGATQSTLPKRARAANVRGAFKASPGAAGQKILIVDDICTTGETLRACASALRAAGADRVCALVVAKAT